MSDKYVLVCQNADCKARQAGELLEALDKRLKDSADITVKPYMCFGGLSVGPEHRDVSPESLVREGEPGRR